MTAVLGPDKLSGSRHWMLEEVASGSGLWKRPLEAASGSGLWKRPLEAA